MLARLQEVLVELIPRETNVCEGDGFAVTVVPEDAGEEEEFGITTITVEEGEVDERGEYSPEEDGEKQPGEGEANW